MMFSFDTQWEKPVEPVESTESATASTSMMLGADIYWWSVWQQIRQLSALQDGWDGSNAARPDPDILKSASELLTAVMKAEWVPPSSIVPSLEGGLLIEWRSGGAYQEIEIEEPYCGEVMEVVNGQANHYDICWGERRQSQSPALQNWPEANEYVQSRMVVA
jgi:hypothetical protein